MTGQDGRPDAERERENRKEGTGGIRKLVYREEGWGSRGGKGVSCIPSRQVA